MPVDAHFTAGLPVKRIAADCLLSDEAGRVLVLEPTYKSTWDIPGGGVEANESPVRAAEREVREEVGLDVSAGALLVVDWKAQDGDFTEVLALLFDGGTLDGSDIGRIQVELSEIRGYRFVTLEQARELLDPELWLRVAAGVAARGEGSTAYLENGSSPR